MFEKSAKKSDSKIVPYRVFTDRCLNGGYLSYLTEEYFVLQNNTYSRIERFLGPVSSDERMELEFIMKLHYDVTQELYKRLLKHVKI